MARLSLAVAHSKGWSLATALAASKSSVRISLSSCLAHGPKAAGDKNFGNCTEQTPYRITDHHSRNE